MLMRKQFKRFIGNYNTPIEFLDSLVYHEEELTYIERLIQRKLYLNEDEVGLIIDVYSNLLESVKLTLPFHCKKRSDAKKDAYGFVSLIYWRMSALKKVNKHQIRDCKVLAEILFGEIGGINELDKSKNHKSFDYTFKNYIVRFHENRIDILNAKLR